MAETEKAGQMEVCAVGSDEFTLGFKLVGIESYQPQELKSLTKGQIGVIITDEKTMNSLDEADRRDYENSIRPIFVVLSETNSQESLNRLIKRSIGIDL
jgi:vacuolar-type H+-ATPase subunit F/Vma7